MTLFFHKNLWNYVMRCPDIRLPCSLLTETSFHRVCSPTVYNEPFDDMHIQRSFVVRGTLWYWSIRNFCNRIRCKCSKVLLSERIWNDQHFSTSDINYFKMFLVLPFLPSLTSAAVFHQLCQALQQLPWSTRNSCSGKIPSCWKMSSEVADVLGNVVHVRKRPTIFLTLPTRIMDEFEQAFAML